MAVSLLLSFSFCCHYDKIVINGPRKVIDDFFSPLMSHLFRLIDPFPTNKRKFGFRHLWYQSPLRWSLVSRGKG